MLARILNLIQQTKIFLAFDLFYCLFYKKLNRELMKRHFLQALMPEFSVGKILFFTIFNRFKPPFSFIL
jgi:hypothetical protein